eukprot:4387645-Pyramimonas_sp.AAC.1
MAPQGHSHSREARKPKLPRAPRSPQSSQPALWLDDSHLSTETSELHSRLSRSGDRSRPPGQDFHDRAGHGAPGSRALGPS